MKRVLIVLVALIVCTSLASAEQKTAPVVYAGGGFSMPLSPSTFSDYWKMGPSFGGGVGFSLNPKSEIIGRVGFSKFPFDGDKFVKDFGFTGITVDGADFKFLAFGVDLKYMFKSGPDAPMAFYLIGGGGMASIKISDITASDGTTSVTGPLGEFSETKAFLNSAFGLDYMVSPQVGIWFEARLVMVLTTGDSIGYLPVRAGLKFAFGGK